MVLCRGCTSPTTRASRSATTSTRVDRRRRSAADTRRPRRGRRRREGAARERETYRPLLAALRELPEVEVAAVAFTAPYVELHPGAAVCELATGARSITCTTASPTTSRALFSMPLVAGRWFSREDDAAGVDACRDQRARWRTKLFGDATRSAGSSPRARPERPAAARRYAAQAEARGRRRRGLPPGRRATRSRSYLLYRCGSTPGPKTAACPAPARPPAARHDGGVRGDARAGACQRDAADWSFEVAPLEHMRERKLPRLPDAARASARRGRVPAADGGARADRRAVAERHQRTREFGLRRAKGATAARPAGARRAGPHDVVRAAGRRGAGRRSCRSCRCRGSRVVPAGCS